MSLNIFGSSKYLVCVEDGDTYCALMDRDEAERAFNQLSEMEDVKVYMARVERLRL